MSKGLKLRPYQVEALDALREGWEKGLSRIAVVLPTGMGKTVIFAELVRASVESGIPPMILVHRDELVNQAVEKIHSAAPHLSVGVVKAERNEVGSDVIVASVQTLARAGRRNVVLDATDIGLLIVDEAHHAAARTYREVMENFGCWDGRCRAAGFTATMARDDDRKLGDIWEAIVYERDILYGIENGYLTDVRGQQVRVDGLDLASVARKAGDYADGSLGDALEDSGAGEVIAAAYAEHAADRQGVVFTPTVSSAIAFANDFERAGISVGVVTGSTPLTDRQLLYKRYRAGDVQVLLNCMVLTEGWDAPWASVAVIARPTSSVPLYVQMVGRVLRPYPGKAEALVLDVVGVSSRLKLASVSDLSKTGLIVDEGESITESKKRKDRERRGGPRGRIEGEVGSREVDLFRASKSAWLQTKGGVWFIATRQSTWFLWPDETDPTAWKVGRCGLYSSRGGTWVLKGLTLEYAMAWAEQEAGEEDSSIASRTSSWRRGKPSEAQMGLAAKLRIPFTPETRRGALSDAISITYASRILDRRASA